MEAENALYLSLFSDWFNSLRTEPSEEALRLAVREVDRKWLRSRATRVRELFVLACQRSREEWLRQRLDRAERDDPAPEPEAASAPEGSDQKLIKTRSCWVEVDGERRGFSNSTKLLMFTLQWCAEKDVSGNPESYLRRAAEQLGQNKLVHEAFDGWQGMEHGTKRYYSREQYLGWHIYKNQNNADKVPIVEALLSAIFTGDGTPQPKLHQDFKLWLPNAGL
ncbi:MAG: hypothetical protein OXE83_10130 [Gammaproteobacteria bacterium]|nr:hypothetical protein [Gammaproteobacteria bacterium]